MGGLGSGRIYRSEEVKPVVENSICLDLTSIKKQGFLKSGNRLIITYTINLQEIMVLNVLAEKDSLYLGYRYQDKPRNQKIDIATIPCLGIYNRKYLLCPACKTNRNQLYLRTDGKFSCRLCSGLRYAVQKLNPAFRHSYAAERIRQKKLKLPENSPHNIFTRPLHMRGKTHEKIVDKIIWHQSRSHELFEKYFNGLKNKYGSVTSDPINVSSG